MKNFKITHKNFYGGVTLISLILSVYGWFFYDCDVGGAIPNFGCFYNEVALRITIPIIGIISLILYLIKRKDK